MSVNFSSLNRLAVYLLLMILVNSGCMSVRMNPRASTDPKLLSGELETTMSLESMEKELTRSDNVIYWPYHLTTYVTLYTKGYVFQKNKANFSKDSYKKRWDENQQKDELLKLAKKQEEDAALVDKKTCFMVRVETSDSAANASDAWHGDLVQGSKTSRLSFGPFVGFSSTTTYASSGSYGVSVNQIKEHYLFSKACSEEAIDITKSFTLILMPRYAEKVPTITLEWWEKGKEGPRKKKRPYPT